MTVDTDALIEGFGRTLSLLKQGADVFSMGEGPMFPTSSSQAKWRYARYPDALHLADGNHVYAFKTPSGESEDSMFPLERLPSPSPIEFGKGAAKSGLAQVHRSDPGAIYFTIQEGAKNPTYTFRHKGGKDWEGVPKKKAKKKDSKQIEIANPALMTQGFKHEISKQAGAFDSVMGNAHKAFTAYHQNPGKAALTGLALGTLWDQGQRHLYNTEEENAQEPATQRLMRYAAPTAALGLPALFFNNLLPNDKAPA